MHLDCEFAIFIACQIATKSQAILNVAPNPPALRCSPSRRRPLPQRPSSSDSAPTDRRHGFAEGPTGAVLLFYLDFTQQRSQGSSIRVDEVEDEPGTADAEPVARRRSLIENAFAKASSRTPRCSAKKRSEASPQETRCPSPMMVRAAQGNGNRASVSIPCSFIAE